jgi:uncharacterized pyridoxamine 5'-phosphate oxidase family protein
MIVTLDKNKKLRLTYDGRSYIIHNHNNHYYIIKDNEKIYCTKEVKEYYKKTKQSQQPKLQPITHTLQMFQMNGNKYAIEKLNKNYCVRRNGIYICTNEVKQVLKQIYGGVPVNISGITTDMIPVKFTPHYRNDYNTRKKFIDSLKLKYDGNNIIKVYGVCHVEERTASESEDSDDEDIDRNYFVVFKDFIKLLQGAYGIIWHSTDITTKYNGKYCTDKSYTNIVVKQFKSNTTIQDATAELERAKVSGANLLIATEKLNVAKAIFNEIDMINKFNEHDLFKESTYARVIKDEDDNSYFIIMEKAYNDLSKIMKTLNKIENNCNYIKVVYSIFLEIYNMFNSCNRVGIENNLYVDVKLENFLYTFKKENDNIILHVIMADYGSFQRIDTELQPVTYTRGDLQISNWKYIAFTIGICLLKLFNITVQLNYPDLENYKKNMSEYFNMFRSKYISTENEITLLKLLLGIKNETDTTYTFLEEENMLTTPEKIIAAFNNYKTSSGCDLILTISPPE